MPFNKPTLVIPLDGTGSEIPTLSVNDPYEIYVITGTVTTTGNYAIVPTGTPVNGTTYVFEYNALVDITTNSNTFSIFGTQLNQIQLTSSLEITCRYNGAVWIVKIDGSLAQEVITTDAIADGQVTNDKLATMSANTLKVNNTGSTATPQDVDTCIIVTQCAWGLEGNTGTTAGTNFIGNLDNQDLIFKVDNVESGRLQSESNGLNTSFGYLSLNEGGYSGNGNSAFGGALTAFTSGNYNCAFGLRALRFTTDGNGNVAIGYEAGHNVVTGVGNTFIGYNATSDNSTSSARISLGTGAESDADYQFAIPDDVTELKMIGISSVKWSALPSYDDNAAAAADLDAGDLYVTSGAGALVQGIVCQVY